MAQLDYPCITDNGWDFDGTINWLDEQFPEDVENILLDEELHEMTDDYRSEVESEDSDEDY